MSAQPLIDVGFDAFEQKIDAQFVRIERKLDIVFGRLTFAVLGGNAVVLAAVIGAIFTIHR